MSDKGFMRLSDEELQWLEKRVGVFDLQGGCPVKCLVCGADSEPFSGKYMSLEDYLTLSESIEQAREEKGIELLVEEEGYRHKGHYSIAPFWASEPSSYRHLSEVVEDMHERHDRSTLVTTSGWKPGNNHMQRNMERIASQNHEGEELTNIFYSVKTVGALARKDWDIFLKRLFGDEDTVHIPRNIDVIRENLEDFFENSKYAAQLVANMATLDGSGVGYMIQYLEVTEGFSVILPEPYRRYEVLFSKECVKALFDWCRERSGATLKSQPEYRAFSGVGRAVTELGLKQHTVEADNYATISQGRDPEQHMVIPQDRYTVKIEHNGTLTIMMGNFGSLTTMPVPNEFFEARTAHYSRTGDIENWKLYRMLANLQGRNLLE